MSDLKEQKQTAQKTKKPVKIKIKQPHTFEASAATQVKKFNKVDCKNMKCLKLLVSQAYEDIKDVASVKKNYQTAEKQSAY